MDAIKKRKPNWSERELEALAEAVVPQNSTLRGKFSGSVTAERKQDIWTEIVNQINSTTMVHRTVEEVKKKWADMLSLTKKKESERRRKMRETGGGPAHEVFFKEWEKLVLQALSDVAIEGITCGVDTAAYENNPSASSVLLSQSATIPDQPGPSTQVDSSRSSTTQFDTDTELPVDFEEPKKRENKQTKVQKKGSESVQERYLALEQEKTTAMETYRKRKLELLQESVALQRRSTIALERIVKSLEAGSCSPISVSPIIKFNS